MAELKRILHEIVIALTRPFMRLMPDKVPVTFIGPDASRDLCNSIAQSGSRKLLIVTDRGLVEIGIVARIAGHLEAAGVTSAVYDGVEPDPTFDQVEAGLSMFRSESCDGILAVGGGSPMDAAKVIAALATNQKPASKLEGWMKVRRLPAPLFAIPTTAGTGSEVTLAAVVSESSTHTKKFFVDPKLIPAMTALDPELMTGLPPHITAATGMDALTHAVESYLARTANEQTRAYAVTAARLVFENLPKAYADGSNVEARRSMALAAYYAGLAFTRTGVGYVHAIAHTFGAYYRTPHGMANAIVLPHVLEFSKEPARRSLAELADAVGLDAGGSRDEAARAEAFIAAVRELMGQIGIPPTLAELRPRDIEPIAKQALGEAYLNYPVPRYMNQEQCEKLISHMSA